MIILNCSKSYLISRNLYRNRVQESVPLMAQEQGGAPEPVRSGSAVAEFAARR